VEGAPPSVAGLLLGVVAGSSPKLGGAGPGKKTSTGPTTSGGGAVVVGVGPEGGEMGTVPGGGTAAVAVGNGELGAGTP
jgi:hypothetical protein